VIFSPHVGGITSGTFMRAHRMIWENIARLAAGQEPLNRVNQPR
jgi:phosphoglycerate dehydrogenase-like enzyme